MTSQNIFGESYDILFGFGIIMDMNFLKYDGQKLSAIQALAVLTILVWYLSYETNFFRCDYDK